MQAEETIAIDLAGKTSLADTMIIASGRNQRHVGAIADKILQDLKTNGYGTARVEGMPACDWVLIDAGDLVIHLFRAEARAMYALERMWGPESPGGEGQDPQERDVLPDTGESASEPGIEEDDLEEGEDESGFDDAMGEEDEDLPED